MTALKLFISHSSRLRPADAGDDQAQRNWQLLQATCKTLKDAYREKIEILVDQDGLHPGDDWEHRLNEWLAECHAAIILFSRRAIDESDWVKKEATILSWRAELDDDFKLFPVLLDQQTTPADLERDFFGTLRINRVQCVQNVATAEQVLAGIRPLLGEPDELWGAWQTPFDDILAAVETLISEEISLASLKALWKPPLFCGPPPATHTGYARALTQHLLNDGQQSLERIRRVIDGLRPAPPQPYAKELLRYVRALWVDAGAAGHIPAARAHHQCLALNGRLVGSSQPELNTHHFTLRRYLERAWPNTDDIEIIPVSTRDDVDEDIVPQICRQIRKWYSEKNGRPRDKDLDHLLREDSRHLIVLLQTADLAGPLADPRLLSGIGKLDDPYRSLIFVLHVGEEMPRELPDQLRRVLPELDVSTEAKQCAAELRARQLINRKYGTAQ